MLISRANVKCTARDNAKRHFSTVKYAPVKSTAPERSARPQHRRYKSLGIAILRDAAEDVEKERQRKI
ncbi:hypothetical protein TSAR_006204 [Trichomalopsis sarcophagae]|uniref:Uncharacterized protein n=1 Tax=Trichomalopsis sarcophagae TaxID=543379 RepID=A0A232FIH6_9HYME|nr:hypothetical protein TSAR_006204 [Trichomalopsis sarcophagae]